MDSSHKLFRFITSLFSMKVAVCMEQGLTNLVRAYVSFFYFNNFQKQFKPICKNADFPLHMKWTYILCYSDAREEIL